MICLVQYHLCMELPETAILTNLVQLHSMGTLQHPQAYAGPNWGLGLHCERLNEPETFLHTVLGFPFLN